MTQPSHPFAPRQRLILSAVALASLTWIALPVAGRADTVGDYERRVAELTRELEEAKRQLEQARQQADGQRARADQAEATLAKGEPQSRAKIQVGPVTIGGAIRANYVLGSYPGRGDGPSRGGNAGDFELDTFRINMSLDYGSLIGKLEYRWYTGYNFLHTGWLGYRFDDESEVQVGLTRVPFGPGPYGVSQSWFFDQHYYVGLADDMDLGLKYVTKLDNWRLDFAYFASSEWNGNGTSLDSARYGYDAVRWTESVSPDGTVNFGDAANGFDERNQFNVRAIYSFADAAIPTDLGVSLQYGQLKGQRTDDASHWAASAHMVNQIGNLKIASQLTRYEYDIDSDNPWGTDTLLPMGAYDFAWPVAAKAWIPAISLSYYQETPEIPWLDSVLPYLEYSSIVKDEDAFNDSQMWTLGAAWSSGQWYVYTDLVYSNGNYFVGDDGDDYSNLFNGVGDFGVTGNDQWNYRFNINFGYYF